MHIRSSLLLRSFPFALSACLAGCILTTSGEDDGGQDGDDTGGDDDSASDGVDDDGVSVGDDSPVDESGDDDSSADDGTTGPSGDCSDNLITDPSFEAGSPSTAWTEESLTFGTPICDASCTEDPGAEPYSGDWWAWFGGVEDPESASVTQDVTIAAADSAVLSFRFSINAAAGTGDDEFAVVVDGTSVWMATDAEMSDYDGYTHVDVDLTDFADGGSHTIRFASDHPGTGLTNFFLDEIHLVTCSDAGTESSGGGESETTAADGSTTGSADGESTTEDGSSSDSGSSDSSSTG